MAHAIILLLCNQQCLAQGLELLPIFVFYFSFNFLKYFCYSLDIQQLLFQRRIVLLQIRGAQRDLILATSPGLARSFRRHIILASLLKINKLNNCFLSSIQTLSQYLSSLSSARTNVFRDLRWIGVGFSSSGEKWCVAGLKLDNFSCWPLTWLPPVTCWLVVELCAFKVWWLMSYKNDDEVIRNKKLGHINLDTRSLCVCVVCMV